jgi:hypothetical protein
VAAAPWQVNRKKMPRRGPRPRLNKTAALAKLKEPPPTGSWRVEAVSNDGRRWRSGMCVWARAKRLRSTPRSMRAMNSPAYQTADILPSDEPCIVALRAHRLAPSVWEPLEPLDPREKNAWTDC